MEYELNTNGDKKETGQVEADDEARNMKFAHTGDKVNEPSPCRSTKVEEEPEEDLEENEEEPEEDAQTEEDNLEAEIRPSYSKILISEVQIGTEGDRKQEFIELYNPNDIEISLTDWYLRKKTKTGSDYSSFASGALFSGKNIFSKSYFLICREGYYSNGLCDIFTGQALSDDNSLALKNPNGEISDKLGFG